LLKAQRLAKIDRRDFPMETLILKTDLEKSGWKISRGEILSTQHPLGIKTKI